MLIRTMILTASVLLLDPFGNQAALGQINHQRESVAGGVAGAIIGGIVGNQNDETAEGVAIGGVVGAIAGNLLGQSKERQLQQRQFIQQQAWQQQQIIEQAQQAQFARALTVDDAITLSQNGVGTQLILNQIQTNGVGQEIGVSEIIRLHQNGVNESVIAAMQKLGSSPVQVAAVDSPIIIDPRPIRVERPVVERPIVVERPVVAIDRGPTVIIKRPNPYQKLNSIYDYRGVRKPQPSSYRRACGVNGIYR